MRFYTRLNHILEKHDFDEYVEGLCDRFYAEDGRPGLPPGRYLRLPRTGYLDGLDAERAIAWRAADSFALRDFLGLVLLEAPPDHSTISRTRRLIDVETREAVFTWILKPLADAGFDGAFAARGACACCSFGVNDWNGRLPISMRPEACAACTSGGRSLTCSHFVNLHTELVCRNRFHHGLTAKLRLKPPSNRVDSWRSNDVGADQLIDVLQREYPHRTAPAKEVRMTPNIADIIRHHVALEVRCIDRVYLHAYMPKLQTSGGLCYFLHDYLGYRVPSPALLTPRHDRFVAAVQQFAHDRCIPVVPFERGESKDARVATYRARYAAREGVVIVGVAQEKMRSFKAHKRPGHGRTPVFDFSRQSVAVNHYYFYVQDRDWGPAFLKIGTYLPYPVKLCLNGHEWVMQRLRRNRIRFASLDNGFLSCADPAALQAACDSLGPADVQAFFDRWSHRLPWPMTTDERAAGYDHRLAICQLEVSLTQVFDRPVQGRHFFEAVIRENLDLGRPDRVRLLFPLRLTRATPPPAFGYRTRGITDGVQPSLHVEYKSSHVKQYFKEQHALRTETTINNPMDFYVRKAVDNLSHLRDLGHQVNRKVLEVERLSHHCVLTQDALDRLQQPTVEADQRVSALRFGDPRVMALFQALCAFTHLPRGFRNRDLRPHVEALLGRPYSTAQMTYDLRRLRLKGLIHRIPGTHRYTATTYGLRTAFFYSKLYLRILRPNWAALLPQADTLPRSLRDALNHLDAEIQKIHEEAAIAA